MARQRPKIIRLTVGPVAFNRLAAKVKDYEVNMHEGMQNLDDVIVVWKYIILRFLLEAPDLTVDTDVLLDRMKRSDPDIAQLLNDYPDVYDSACIFIEDLVKKKF